MGIDPGTNFMGYAIIKVFGKNQKPELVVSGIVDMIKITDPYIKLQRIFSRTLQVIDSYQPDELAILWKERSIHAKTRPGSRGCYCSCSPKRYPHFRICSTED